MKEKIAVVGVSKKREKWGYKVYMSLSKSSVAYPVNPKYDEIEGNKCYPDLKSLPEIPDMVITVVPPEVTEKTVSEAAVLGIKKVWMQPGSESKKAVEYCRKNGIEVVHGACIIRDAK